MGELPGSVFYHEPREGHYEMEHLLCLSSGTYH